MLSIAISIIFLTGCNPQTMMTYQLNNNLPRLNNVKVVADNTAVGFEWQPLYKKGLDGVNIYRTEPNAYANSSTKRLTKIATVNNPFASHYVDTNLKQNSTYTYTFTTIKGGYESAHGKIISIKTLPMLPKVTFFQGAQKAKSVIKLIWRPHPDKRVKMYKIEKSINGSKWAWVETLNNRLMVEYIDMYVKPKNKYQYRIIAVGFDGSYSIPSDIVTIYTK
jgi:fibronectin type 3 domain-containing protein